MALTVSLNKGKMQESNFAHNERKSRLKDKSQEVVESFYATENHKHIRSELTRLNIDRPHENFTDVYDRLFGKAVEEYNARQKRKDRKIGKGKAVPGELKKNNITELKIMLDYLSKSNTEKEEFSTKFPGGKQLFEETFLKKYQGKTETDLKKSLAFWRSQETYGEAYYKQVVKDKKTKTHVEFVAQLGNAEDFNEIKDGKIVKSYDREDPSGRWQKAKKVLKMYVDEFQDRNPNLVLVGYSIHMDESSPHVHFDVIPVAEKSKIKGRGKRKNGLNKKISFDGALQSQGFSGKPKQLFTEWQHQETSILADLMQREMGEKRKAGKTNHIENIHEYKKLKALEASKLEKIARLNEQLKDKQTGIADLEKRQKDITKQLSKSLETVKKVQTWTEKKTQELDDREKGLDSRELILSDREEKVTAKEKTLKVSQTRLESEKKAFDKKVREKGNLDQQLDDIRSTLSMYSSNLDKKKKQILDEKQKKLDEERAKQVAEYKQQVARDKQNYLDSMNRQYRKSLEQREKAVEQREKRFKDKIKNLVTDFRLVYISEGLKSMFGTKREVKYRAQQYLQMDRDQQKIVEKQAFSGPGGLYRKISAFESAVDHLFHGTPDAAELSPLQSLDDLAGEAKTEARRYDNLQNSRAGLRNSSPSSPSSGPEL